MGTRRRQTKQQLKVIASQRIQRLFVLAEQNALRGKLDLADRNVYLARKISMKYLIPIPAEWKRRFCKHCYSYHLPGVTCRVRINKGMLTTYCNICQKYYRIPLKPSK